MPGIVFLLLSGMGLAALGMAWPSAPALDGGRMAIVNEMDLYRIFARHAVEYMAANPAASGTIPWSAIQAGGALPSARMHVAMPDGWRAVADGTGDYVLCTETRHALTPGTLGTQLERVRRSERVHRVGGKWVIGNAGATSLLAAEAAKCD